MTARLPFVASMQVNSDDIKDTDIKKQHQKQQPQQVKLTGDTDNMKREKNNKI